MSTNAPAGGDPLAQVQATTKGIAQGLGVLYKQLTGLDPSGQGTQMVGQMIQGIAALEEFVQQPPAPPAPAGPPQGYVSDDPYDMANQQAQAEMMAAQQGGF